MKKITTFFTALALLMGLCACSKKVEEPTWQEQFDLGVRYLTSIKGTFWNCSSLTSITIPAGVTTIDSTMVNGCSNLVSIRIPASVTSIEFSAFGGCDRLTDVYYVGTEEQWATIDGNRQLQFATIHFNS